MKNKATLFGRREILKGIGSLAGYGALSSLFGLPSLLTNAFGGENNSADSLRERAARKGLVFGAASGCNLLTRDKEFAARFAEECGMLVPENELMWNAVRPSPDGFNFGPGDCLAEFARKNNMLFRGHALVWHEALPAWFHRTVGDQNAEQILRSHINKVVGHYAGKTHSWDVVNEAIAPWQRQPDGMRDTPWLRLLGPKYMDISFRTAAAADPKTLLVYNQNHLEYDSKGSEACRNHTLNLLRRLKTGGTPVHALGIQAHLTSEDGKFNPQVFRKFLREVAGLDLKIMMTEMDVIDRDITNDIFTRDKIISGKYEELLSVALDEPAVIAVLTWGLSDKYTWVRNYFPRRDDAAVRPLPLDESFHRKQAWHAIARAFDQTNVSPSARKKAMIP
ncbi:MAG: endo-1,4-beta-xylanase [Nitrospinae bacterium]|nr:endo-1,4-beta-xylanase [Nitrospinota bacterium]